MIMEDSSKMVKKITKSFIKGIGSVLDISPQKKYRVRTYLPTQSSKDRLGKDWERVGKAISSSVRLHSNGKK